MARYYLVRAECPGWAYPARSVDEVCPKRHRRVGGVVYHEVELPSSMWARLRARREVVSL